MKKVISIIISTVILITSFAFPSYAIDAQSSSRILPRETNIDKYDSETLLKKILAGSIKEDQFTNIDIQRAKDSEGEVTTVTIRELKERKIVQGKAIDSYVQQTSSTRSIGSLSTSSPYQGGQNSFTLNFKLTYDRLNYGNGYLYKITRMDSSYTNVVGRLSFKKLELYCSASSDAYISTTQRIGWRSENATRTFNAPITPDTNYSKSVSFNYYYYDEPNGASIGGNSTIYYTVSNQTTQHSFMANLPLV